MTKRTRGPQEKETLLSKGTGTNLLTPVPDPLEITLPVQRQKVKKRLVL